MPESDAESSPVRLGRYRHYKGQDYQVLGLCRHTETEEDLVLYRSLYGDHALWVRPRSMFFESGVFVEGQPPCPRFTFIEPM